jgi:hypothetical protein
MLVTVFVGDRWNTIHILRANLGQTDQDRVLGSSSGECELGVREFIPSKTCYLISIKKKKDTDMENT